MRRLNLALRLAMAGATICLGGAAQATKLVTNGGFETGDFTAWSQFGNLGFSDVGENAHSGDFSASFGPVGSLGGISQTIATVAGGLYTVDFWLFNAGGTGNEFEFNWNGGVAEAAFVDADTFDYSHFTYELTASSSSTSISFSFRQDPSYMFLDDVAVEENKVPEPTTFALLGLGLAGLGFTRRKKSSLQPQ